MLNENEIRLLTAGLVLLLAIGESRNDPAIPEIERLLIKLKQMRDTKDILLGLEAMVGKIYEG